MPAWKAEQCRVARTTHHTSSWLAKGEYDANGRGQGGMACERGERKENVDPEINDSDSRNTETWIRELTDERKTTVRFFDLSNVLSVLMDAIEPRSKVS